MKKTIFDTIITKARLRTLEDIDQAQTILDEYLKSHPRDTNAWLLAMRLEYSGAAFPDKIMEYANHVLSYEPSNISALLFLSYVDYYSLGSTDENLYSTLLNAKTNDSEMLAMLEVAKARYWEDRDLEKCIAALKKSIEYSQHQRINFCMLGQIYIQQKSDYKQILEGAELIKRGLSNIKLIVDENTLYDPTSVSGFFDEFFSGTVIGFVEYEILKMIITVD